MTDKASTGRGIAALDPVPPVVLVLTGITSIQFGAALAATLFDELGPSGTSVLRLGLAALVMVAFWRPKLSSHRPEHVRLALIFGLVLGAMNLTFYEALDRIPLGTAVTIEFIGPIAVAAVATRSTRNDGDWADELDRHRLAEVDAFDRQVEEHVHQRRGDAEQGSGAEFRARPAFAPRS